MKIEIEQIARNESMNYSYLALAITDSFSITWLCSHFRIVSMKPCKEINALDFLIWVLLRDPTNPQFELRDWLPNCELKDVEAQEIITYIEHAKSDLIEGKSEPGSEIGDVDFPLSGVVTNNLKWAFSLKGKQKPCNKHSAGPTYIHIWKNGDNLYYLEIHNES
ncbi:hypothetical protein [Zooshikella sp. RANM57]